MNFTRPHLDDLLPLALAAAREIMVVRSAGFATQDKSDGSPVTIADQRAEAMIEAGLAKLSPGVAMIGEEAFAAGRIPECGQAFFCVDPLDGTRDFIAGGDEFTVNIALVEQGQPTMGVVLAPVSGEVFAGEPGRALKGVFDMQTGALVTPLTPIHTASVKPANGWRVFASKRAGKTSRTTIFLEALGPHIRTRVSSSIKFCRIAEGGADIYPRFGELNEWDAAAGHALLSAAGGGVMDLNGAPLLYGQRDEGFLIRGFVAFASAAAASAARTALSATPTSA